MDNQARTKNCSGCNDLAFTKSRRIEALGIAIPGVILALLPKCPVCVAAYIAFFTSVSISIQLGGMIRIGLLTVASATFVYFLVRSVSSIQTFYSIKPKQ